MANKSKFGLVAKDALILFLITLVAGVALGFFNDLTKDTIAARAAQEKQEKCAAVLPAAASFEASEAWKELGTDIASDASFDAATGTVSFTDKATCRVKEVLEAKDASGAVVGHVVTVTSKNGYGGDIDLLVGIGEGSTVTGVEVLEMSESPGLGDNAKKQDFRDQFKKDPGKPFVVVKNGASADNEIQALSGATITSNAVTHAVNSALYIVGAFAE